MVVNCSKRVRVRTERVPLLLSTFPWKAVVPVVPLLVKVPLLLSAANKGVGPAQFAVGLCYHRGEGVARDLSKAQRWYKKAAKQGVSIDWVVTDARTFHLQKQFPFIYMLENVFQFFLTRADQEAMLARVREHLLPEGCFLFETRNPTPRNLLEGRRPEPQKYTLPDGGNS